MYIISKLLVVFMVVSLFPTNTIAEERITLSTYYPAPYGEYRTLAIGDSYVAPNSATNTDLVVEGRVGIGMTDPREPLSIETTDNYEGIRISNPDPNWGELRLSANRIVLRPDDAGGGRLQIYNSMNDGMTVLSVDTYRYSDDPNSVVNVYGKLAVRPYSDTSEIFSITSAFGLPAFTVNTSASGGNVGIGTDNPQSVLHVGANMDNGATPSRLLITDDGDYDDIVKISRSGVANPQSLRFGVNQAGAYGVIQAYQEIVGASDLILQKSGGNVGIGTKTPGAKLEVEGDIMLGANNHYAASSHVPTRVIQGYVQSNGTTSFTNGFTSSRGDIGQYKITYNTPFSGIAIPIASATAGAPPRFAVISSANDEVCNIWIYNSSGIRVDGGFYLIIVGPE